MGNPVSLSIVGRIAGSFRQEKDLWSVYTSAKSVSTPYALPSTKPIGIVSRQAPIQSLGQRRYRTDQQLFLVG